MRKLKTQQVPDTSLRSTISSLEQDLRSARAEVDKVKGNYEGQLISLRQQQQQKSSSVTNQNTISSSQAMGSSSYSSGYNAANFISKVSENTYTPNSLSTSIHAESRQTGATITPRYAATTSTLSKNENEPGNL
jgi:hypothetical protein